MDAPEKKSIDARPSHGTVGAVMGLLSPSGPEASPDEVRPSGELPWPDFGDEPTQLLPIVPSARWSAADTASPFPAPAKAPAATPRFPPAAGPKVPVLAPNEPPLSKVEARAVIVYESEPRRRWGLWVLTAVLVALTMGVVLGQTVANQPGQVTAAAREVPTTGYSTPPQPVPSPADQVLPVRGQRVTAPLGKAKTRLLEVIGISTLVTVRSVDLGDKLFDIATLDTSAVPKVLNGDSGPRLELVQTGATGRVGAEIQLNSRVKWTLRLTGGSSEQDIDMRAGGLAGIELIGGASRAVLQLPIPKGTVPLTVTGGVSDLNVRTGSGVPVRVRLDKGADSAVIDGSVHQRVRSGTALSSTGWKDSQNRYDVSASARVSTLQVAHV
jgi:hypothetical protein